MPGMPGIPPPAICSIILRASTKRFTSLFTSETCTPAPLAIRARRDPLRMLTSSRSAGVIEKMIASIRSTSLSSIELMASLNCPAPGSIPKILLSGPSFRSCCICARKSWSPKRPLPALSFSAASREASASKFFSACSIRVSTSPMPRMREAFRSGWKTSKSARVSPLDANRMGLPITRAIESAAPPRASPSSLVSTTPSKPMPSSKAFAVLTASWPIMASTTNSTSSGLVTALMSAACCISTSSMPNRPAVSITTTS